MNDTLFNHVARYAEDLALLRLARAALPPGDSRIIDLIQAETKIAVNLTSATRIQNEYAPIADIVISQEILSRVKAAKNVRRLLCSLLDTDGFKGRELRSLVNLVIRAERGLYYALVQNRIIRPRSKPVNEAVDAETTEVKSVKPVEPPQPLPDVRQHIYDTIGPIQLG